MNLYMFEKILKQKKDNGKTYTVICGMNEICIPFCYLAEKHNFQIDGIITVDDPRPSSEDYSNFKILNLNENPMSVGQCIVIFAMGGEKAQSIYMQLQGMGFNSIALLDGNDINEMQIFLQQNNYVLNKIREKFQNGKFKEIFIFKSGAKSEILQKMLSSEGFPIEGIIDANEIKSDSLLIMPIETDRHKEIYSELSQNNSENILPLYKNDLRAAEIYFGLHNVFYNYFDLEHAPDYVAKYEKQAQYILNLYDGVNISSLNVLDESQMIISSALSYAKVDKKILHAVLPLNNEGNQIVENNQGGGYLTFAERFENLKIIKNEDRYFWQYFIKKYPFFVTYSDNIYNYYLCHYREKEIKIETRKNSIAENSNLIMFSLQKNYEWFDALKAELNKNGLRAEKLTDKFSEFKAKLLVTDSIEDRYIAMIHSIPAVMINMFSFTLDDKLKIRSEKTSTLFLPKKIFNSQVNFPYNLYRTLHFEEMIPNERKRIESFNQNNIEIVESNASEIFNTIIEMLMRIDGHKYNEEEIYMLKTCKRIINWVQNNYFGDLYDGDISIQFLKNNKWFLGEVYNVKDKLQLKNFLPQNELSKIIYQNKTKIKIRMIFSLFYRWNSFTTLCEECLRDKEMDLLVIANNKEDMEILKRKAYNCVLKNEYNIEEDKPDVFIITDLSDQNIGNVRKNTRFVIVSSNMVILYGAGKGKDYIDKIENYWASHNPDYYLFDSYVYSVFKKLDYFKNKPLIEMGNPKYDGIYKACQNKKFPDAWKKLSGKKIFLWAADHGLYDHWGILDDYAFDFYAKYIFEYFSEHKEFALIYRPHPLVVEDLVNVYSIWKTSDLKNFRDYCSESENIIFDETENYDNAFSVADAILLDPHCGIIASSLPLLKPICRLCKSHHISEYAQEITDNYYAAYSKEDLYKFFEMIRRGEDPMYDLRKAAAEKYVKHFDGKNGLRIKEFIKKIAQN